MREVYSLEQAYQLAQDHERFQRWPVSRQPEPHNPGILGSRPSQAPGPISGQIPRPSSNQVPQNRPLPVGPPLRREEKGKGVLIENPRPSSSGIRCFKCNAIGHFASQCPTRALHIGEPEVKNPKEPRGEEDEVYIAGTELVEAYEEPSTLEEAGPEDRVGVVRCVLVQPKESEDWRRTAIFHTYIGQGNKVCKVIIDSGSCINAISTNAMSKLGLTPIDHPSPYMVAWIDASSIPVRHRCLVPIKFQSYQEDVW